MRNVLFVLLLLATLGFAQPVPRQDPAALALAKSIYTRAFTDLRDAHTMEDMRKLSNNLESAEWVSLDRFGRKVLTRADADRDLASMLSLPAERRVTEMDILWAEQDADRLMVLAWMMPHESESGDDAGQFGPKGSKHRLMRATLIRDLFVQTAEGWRRVQHDKLTPNGIVVAVDGNSPIVPPVDEAHRAAPGLPLK